MAKYFPYLLGGFLFFVSAARFCAQSDFVGAAIAGAAGLVAVLSPIVRRNLDHPESG